jgi:hypothetical protein
MHEHGAWRIKTARNLKRKLKRHGEHTEAENRLLYAWRMKIERNLKLQAQETRASQRESGEHTESDESLDEQQEGSEESFEDKGAGTNSTLVRTIKGRSS